MHIDANSCFERMYLSEHLANFLKKMEVHYPKIRDLGDLHKVLCMSRVLRLCVMTVSKFLDVQRSVIKAATVTGLSLPLLRLVTKKYRGETPTVYGTDDSPRWSSFTLSIRRP